MKAELDWFEFETRMRMIVTQLLQPILETIDDHSTNLESTNKSLTSHNNRLKNIENLTGTSNKKTGWILETEEKLNSLALEIRLLSNTTTQKFIETEQQVNNNQVSVKESQAISEQLSKEVELLEQDMETLQNTLHDVNNNLKLHFEAVQDDFSSKFQSLQTELNECKTLSDHNMKRTAELSQKTNENFHHMDKMRLMMREQSMQMIQLVHEKASVDEFIKLSTSVDTRVDNALEKLRLMENRFHEMVRYVDVYLPFDIQVYISDNLYSCLNKKNMKMWMKFEEQRRRELQKKATDFDTVSKVENILQKTLDSIKNFETRKDDIYFKMIRRKIEEGSSSSDESPKGKKFGSLSMRQDLKKNFNASLDQDTVDELIKAKQEFASLISAMKDSKIAQDSLKAFVLNELQEFKVNLNVVQKLWRDTRAEDNESFIKEVKFSSDRIEAFRHKLKDCFDAIMNMADLVSALTEFSIVISGVLDQEEKDKKEVVKQTSELSLPPVHSRKGSLAPFEYLSGKGLITKSTSTSIPTSLKYRNALYTREELIELISKVVSKAWSEASIKIPFNPKKAKTTSTSQNLNKTLNVSSSILRP